MAKQMAKSALAAKLGSKLDKAVDAHKNDETVLPKGGNLPPGIEGGIAQLTVCKFDVYKEGDFKGEFYFQARAVVVEPKVHLHPVTKAKIITEGMQTMIMEPICDTPKKTRKTVDEHVSWVLNQMRMLGVDTSGVTSTDMEAVAAALQEERPYVKFRTWQGQPTKQYPNPGVNEVWMGRVEDSDLETVLGGEDSSEPTDGGPSSGEESISETTEEPSSDEGGEAEDLNELAALADANDDSEECAAAQVKLEELATAQGINTSEYATWAEVAELLQAGDSQPAEESSQAVPSVGEVWFYQPPKSAKAIECEVEAVFEKKNACNLKNLEDGKTKYRNVDFSALKDTN